MVKTLWAGHTTSLSSQVNSAQLWVPCNSFFFFINAINAGDCKFVKLTAEECGKCLKTYKACERKTRSDAGKKKK